MQQKYSHLQEELRSLAESMQQNENSVLKLLNKHIMEKPKGQSTHPHHLRLSRFSTEESILSDEQHFQKDQRLVKLLNELFLAKCSALEVYSSEDRRCTFVNTLLKRNPLKNRLDLSVCNLPQELSKHINKYLTTEVTRVNLSQNQLNLNQLPRLFHSELSELVLSNCGLQNANFDVLFDSLKNSSIVRLCLSSPLPINRNILTKYSNFYEFILSSPTLSILELASLQITQYEQLFKVCSKSNVTSLDLSGNDHVRGTYPTLQVLKLRNNSLDKLNEFSQLDNFPQLYYLDVSNNQITGGQFSFLFKSKPSTNLKVLIADQNILMYKLDNFEHYISTSCWIQRLSLRKCRIGEEGMRQLISGVANNHDSLQFLDISNNRVSREACGWLAEALKTSGLRELILVECQITDEGGERLAVQLKNNRKLEHLNFTQNRLNAKMGKALVTTLHLNTTLNKLILLRNAIPYDHMKEITSSVKRNHYLRVKYYNRSRPPVKVSLPQQIIEEEQHVSRIQNKLRLEVRQLRSLYDELHDKCREVGDFQEPPEFENDGTAEGKYQRKLESLQAEIARIQNQKNFVISNSSRAATTPRVREQPSSRTNISNTNRPIG